MTNLWKFEDMELSSKKIESYALCALCITASALFVLSLIIAWGECVDAIFGKIIFTLFIIGFVLMYVIMIVNTSKNKIDQKT